MPPSKAGGACVLGLLVMTFFEPLLLDWEPECVLISVSLTYSLTPDPATDVNAVFMDSKNPYE